MSGPLAAPSSFPELAESLYLQRLGPTLVPHSHQALVVFFFSFHFGIKDNKALGLVPGTPLLIEC